MAEGGGSTVTTSRYMTGSPQMFTDWDGLMDDLFHNKDISELIDSPIESSSGIASDSPTWHRPPSSSNSSLSTYKLRSSSPDTDEARSNRMNPGYASSSSSNEMFFEAGQLGRHPVYSSIAASSFGSCSPLTPPPPHQWRDSPYDLKRQKNDSRGMSIKCLPDEAMLNILSYLPTNHLCRCARVCSRWYNLVWEPSLWTRIQINDENINIDKALRFLLRRLSEDTPHVCLNLKSMNLKQCVRLSDKGLHLIAKRCPELTHLELNGCSNISNMALSQVVSNCTNIQHLNVTGCVSITSISLTPEALTQANQANGSLSKQILLRLLDLTDCPLLDDSGMQIIASYCSQLQYIYLRRCTKITDDGIHYLANSCNMLRELSVSDCRKVSDYGLRGLSKLELNLRYLSVAKCDKVSDLGIKYIAKHCRKLRYLNVRGCEAVSDESIESLAQNCSRMRSLDLGKCDVTDDGLFMIASHCSQLKKLSVKSCDAITDAGVLAVAKGCKHLQHLNIQDCHLSSEAYRAIKKQLKRCIIEHTNPGFY
ncbi:F-box/LRR-repeat protein 7-like [Watersipora subatra]|uniref:F-box/LRR-repeat protein 7-like n=1 Tax=Watersipora subatra TaxID=2589382 RepID=UPI00355B7DC7